MRSRLYTGLIVAAFFIANIFAVQPVLAQSFSFPTGGFSSANVCANSPAPATGCQVLTNGSPDQPQVLSNGTLRLNTANQNEHGSAWFAVQQPLSTGFTTAFQFQISNANGCVGCSFPADGIALVIQNDPAGTGALGYSGNGGNIGYGDNDVSNASGPGNAILNSLAIELDTFQNTEFGDPDGNHIAVQSCGPNNSNVLTPNSPDHNYLCPDGNMAKLALQSLPSGMSLSDGNTHTITVNYLPPGSCTSACNNLSVYFDSTLILQATVNLATQLNLTSGSNAYVGFTAATGGSVENNDIISWSFSQWPLSPITINQPVQTTATNFNYTSTLSAITDYSQSGLPASAFQGLFMQGSVQTITDQQFSDLVNNTPFQGSTCQHQDTGNGTYACVTTTDLCTNPSSSTPAGANCLGTTGPLINVSNTYNLDPSQKPVIAPGYIMGKDNAISCGANADNSCKGLVSVFTGMNGDLVTTGGHTNNFNSVLIPILGNVQPSTSVTTTPPLNSGWTNGNISVNFNSIDIVPSNNTSPPATLPTVTSINYSVTGPNLPAPAAGTVPGAAGSVAIPVTAEGTTVITYAATDSANIVETLVTNSGNQVSSATPTFSFKVDLTPPTVSCTPPAITWQASDVVVPCTARDNPGGSGLVGSSAFSLQTNVPLGTETNTAVIPPVTVKDVAGNISAPQPALGSFGPFEVDKKPPVISGPTISPASPVFGQSVSANYSCTDGGSGVVQCGPSGSATFTATASTGPLSSPVSGSAGPHTFTVVAQDAVNNQSAPSTVSYTIGQATPVITWANPAPIAWGTPLTATQLNATANVPGRFVYTPAAGTLLSLGTHTLSVVFTPTDAVDYSAAKAQVSVLVAVPLIGLNPIIMDFGTVASGGTATQTETISNIGKITLNINGISIASGITSSKGDFTFTTNCGSSLAPGASCNAVVTFHAISSGTRLAGLVIADNAPLGFQIVPLVGTVGKKGK